ncbi:MAG: hypothetical protein K1Y02_20210 [Candidatus Hydrogenedentes bacterium]|nr:hypothetical protein [Candidatus Hydrogenedentota bacterium]
MPKLIALCLIASSYSALALDISQYELIRENVVTKSDSTEWDYVLAFKDTPFRVELGPRRANDEQTKGFDNDGLNEETLKIVWLEEDKWLWITWRTFLVGSGAFIAQANIVLRLEGERLTESLREGYLAREQLGAGLFWHKEITYEWSAKEERLHKKIAANDRVWSDRWIPAAEQVTQSGYVRDVNFTEDVTYKLVDDRLEFEASRILLDLGDRKVPAGEIAQLFVLYLIPRWSTPQGEGECTIKERADMLQSLGLKEGTAYTGKINGPSWTQGVFKPLGQKHDFYPF